ALADADAAGAVGALVRGGAADAVVGDGEHAAAVGDAQRDLEAARLGVAQDVGDGLLRDAVERRLALGVEAPAVEVAADVDGEPGGLDLAAHELDRGDEAELVEHPRAQALQDAADAAVCELDPRVD